MTSVAIGTIVEVKGDRAAVELGSDNNSVITPLIRWTVRAAGSVNEQRVPSVGEQVVLLNTVDGSKTLASMVIIGYLHSSNFPAPHTEPDKVTLTTGGYTSHINTSGAEDVSGNTRSISMKSSITEQAGTYSLTADTITEKSETHTADTKSFIVTGMATIQKALSASAGMMKASPAGVAIKGLMESASATIGGIVFSSHQHKEQGDGKPTSPPIGGGRKK